ncbi:MAG: hypothetical protein LBH51_07495 [Treponema sp.]|jgi:hypothetical protein|nr:hypothetical protein [Treponema sp.]
MCSPIFFRRKGVFTGKVFSLFFLFCLVTGAAFFSGCRTEADGPAFLEGTWIDPDSFDSYVIKDGILRYDDGFDGGEYDMDMAGKIEEHSDFSAPAGIIYVTYTSPDSLAGKCIALYWKGLTGTQVDISIAINNSDYSNPAVDTIDAAREKFSLDNVGDWISYWGGPYQKQ